MVYSCFRHLAIQSPCPAPTHAQLAAIEGMLGASLPSSFRDFLNVGNGGYLDYAIDVPTGPDRTEAIHFCQIFPANEMLDEIRDARQGLKTPQAVLPFARDGGGSMLFLDLSPEGNGRIIALVLGLPEWTGLRTETDYVVLASCFDEYVADLRIDRTDLFDRLEHANYDVEIEGLEEFLDIGMPQWREDAELVAMIQATRGRVTAYRPQG